MKRFNQRILTLAIVFFLLACAGPQAISTPTQTPTLTLVPPTATPVPSPTVIPTSTAVQVCDETPPQGYTRSIHAPVDGDELTITVSDRFGGAVESLKWRGKEFINTWDHGREISYAWGMNDYGECFNPTEPGSSADYKSLDSTSELMRVCSSAENNLTTTTQPAYWLAPGESGFCGKVETAFNTSPISDQLLEKTIEIGYHGLENVIAFTAVITLPESYQSNQLEIPTGYLTYEFNKYWIYNPSTHTLTQPESIEPPDVPWSFEYVSPLPPILSTDDGAYAMGAYSAEAIELYYGIFATNSSDKRDRTNKWTIVIREEPAPARTYTYRSFVIVGTLEEVQNAMNKLNSLHPVDLNPPEGYVDVANCQEIAGWAWNPQFPNVANDVEFYALESDGTKTLLGRVTASQLRSDLVTALGDNGKHGYSFPTSDLIHDNRPIVLLAYAVSSEAGFLGKLLEGSGQTLQCP